MRWAILITFDSRRSRRAVQSRQDRGYLYSIRLVGKRLKAWNRTVYYLVKWLLFGGIAVAIFWRF